MEKPIHVCDPGACSGSCGSSYGRDGAGPCPGYIPNATLMGRGITPYQLLVRGLEADEVALDLNLSERTYTRKKPTGFMKPLWSSFPGIYWLITVR